MVNELNVRAPAHALRRCSRRHHQRLIIAPSTQAWIIFPAISDVIILGAGLAGAAAAAVLGRDGYPVSLIDPKPQCSPAFKAEKIEPDQADAFRRLGLMQEILPKTAAITKISEAHNGRVLRVVPIEQYGIFYQDMVNTVPRQIPDTIELRVARAGSRRSHAGVMK